MQKLIRKDKNSKFFKSTNRYILDIFYRVATIFDK